MKKTYIEPTIKVVKVQQMQVIAASPAGADTAKSHKASSEYETLTKGNDVGNIWDDDDE